MSFKLAAFALLMVSALGAPAAAHQPSESYLSIRSTDDESTFTLRWDIALVDLEHAVGLDGDDDGSITWGEVKRRSDAFSEYALAHLTISAGGVPCAMDLSPRVRIDEHGDRHYAVLDIVAECRRAPGVEIGYHLLFDIDPTHRGLLVYESGTGPIAGVLSAEQRIFSTADGAPGIAATFGSFVGQGVHHIAIGYDHIAFLVLLLLPAGLARRPAGTAAAASANAVAIDILKVVTAFTLAHSLTLGLAATGVLVLPPSIVEATIAASIIVAALINLLPKLHAQRWWIAFAFGLVHGFGFANVLGELDLGGVALAVPLAGFNVGVELGQLLIAAAALPLLLLLRRRPVYRRWVLPGGSAAVALLASYWLVGRLTG